MKQGFIYIVFLVFPFVLTAQQDTIQHIDEVRVYSKFSPKDQIGYRIYSLSDSVLQLHNYSFVHLLQSKANIYLKQYGNGMVATMAMRGTGASHTAVYWNGIPINSSLNGQTDFNTINPAMYQHIAIRKGGGSVLLGSGAMGGAINLTNNISFLNQTKGSIAVALGSYQTYNSVFTINHSSRKLALQAGGSFIQSQNDYPYLGSDRTNENGAFKNFAVTIGLGYKLQENSRIYYKTLLNNSDRNTSGSLSASSKANLVYKRDNHLLEWVTANHFYNGRLKLAYTNETYQYVFDTDYPTNFSDNKGQKWIVNYMASYAKNTKLSVQSGITIQSIVGEGTNIGQHAEKNLSVFTGLNYTPATKFKYNVSLRKEWSDSYKIPLLVSVSGAIKWNNHWLTTYNVSTNFKSPTLNDLYWQPGGNTHLNPEKSWNSEVGVQWKNDKIKMMTNGYFIQASDLIQWKPTTDNFVWQPVNIQNVNIFGLEYDINYNFQIKNHKTRFGMQYSYTLSTDKNTGKQLIYVPYHKASTNVEYDYYTWKFAYNTQYNSRAYTTTSNTSFVPGYWISSIALSKVVVADKLHLSAVVKNLFNKKYQIVSDRPMPNINYKLNVQFKF